MTVCFKITMVLLYHYRLWSNYTNVDFFVQKEIYDILASGDRKMTQQYKEHSIILNKRKNEYYA